MGKMRKMTKEERSWILYDWANSAYSIVITTAIFPIYFKTVVTSGVEGYASTSMWGYANTIASLVIAVLAPVLGTIADYRGMKKRFFTFFFSVGVVGTLSLFFITQGQWMSALLIYAATAIGFAGANIFYDSYLVDVTTRERMDWVSSSGFAWGYIGSCIPFVLGIGLVLTHKTLGIEQVLATRISFLITGGWWLVFSIPILKNVKQQFYIQPHAHPIRESFKRLGKTLSHIKQYKQVFLFLIAYFFYIDGVDTIIKMAIPIANDIGIDQTTQLVVLFLLQVVAFPFALLYGRLANRFSARRMIFIGIGVYIVITIVGFFLPLLGTDQLRTIFFWLLALLVGSSQGGIQALSRSFYGKIIPRKYSAEFFGFYNIFGKFAAIVGPLLVALFSTLTKNSAFGILSISILFIIGGIFLRRVRVSEDAGTEAAE